MKLAVALFLPGAVWWLLAGSGLGGPGCRMAALFAGILTLWAMEAVPVAVTALLAVALQPILGIEEVKAAFASFISPVFFFVLSMFFLAAAIVASGVDRRFALALLVRA